MNKEYIEREAVQKIIDYIRDKYCTYYNRGCKTTQFWWDTIRYFEKRIRALPAADVVEVVRCKDCKHAIIVDDVFHEDEVACSLLSQDVECDNYCMYGEKGEQWHIGKEEDPYEVREKMDKEE